MEVGTLKDAFDHAVKRQKVACSKTIDLVNHVEKEIEQAIRAFQENGKEGDIASNQNNEILLMLKNKLEELIPMKQLESCQKEMHTSLSKWVKLTDKFFISDISKAYKNVDMEPHVLNEIIANHLYREALFDIGDNFIGEATSSASIKLKQLFQKMYEIQGALQTGNSNLAPFATMYKAEFQRLIASILWAGRLDQSPYTEFLLPTNWEKLAEEFVEQFCNLEGQSSAGLLGMTVAAGVEVLPILLKLMNVLTAKREWQSMKQFPYPLDLRPEFQFHSVFVCPVLREEGSDDNPPMLLPCGHVLSKQSTVKLSKNSSRAFILPFRSIGI
ncbi:unnamed protein product [Alopecurus aequalis]